jgi:homocysteine S-methyltransferase
VNALAAELSSGRVLIGDGGIGTRLATLGVEPALQPFLPLAQPDRVEALHLEYLRAGARLLETHTFQANAPRLASLNQSADVRHLNRRAAQIARHARDIFGEEAYIVGSLGPLGQPVARGELVGIHFETARAAYAEQAAGLLAGGVDGFLIETMSDLGSVEAAVAAVRGESALPILVSFAFSLEGVTRYGLLPEEAARALLALAGGPPAAAGANCGTGPMPLLDAILRMAPILQGAGIPLLAYPNAGQPTRRDDGVYYPAGPAYMAGMTPALVSAGARIVGGCCGTGPEHIAALLAGASPRAAIAPASIVLGYRPASDEEPFTASHPDATDVSAFGQKLHAGEFVVSVELDPPRSPNPTRLLAAARRLQTFAVDAINIADSPMARVRMSALATGALMLRTCGIEPIMHFTTRDRNRMGIASDLLGAHALGLRNVLCLTGDPPGLGDYAHATAVYDLTSAELVRVLAAFNRGEDGLGHALGQATAFTIGVGVNPNAPDLHAEAERLRHKLEGGAHFIMSQPLYSEEQLLALLDETGPLSVPLLIGIMPLVSLRQAEYLHNEVPGISIPAPVREAMARAGNDGVQAGVDLSLQFLSRVEHLVQGAYLVPSFNRIDPLASLLAELESIRARRRAS